MAAHNEIEFEFEGETHHYEPKPITLNLLTTVGSIKDPESEASNKPLDVMFLRNIDGKPAHKAHIGLRVAAGFACIRFLTAALKNLNSDGSE